MATVSRSLPEKPHLDVPKREARTSLKDLRAKLPEALDRVRLRHPKFHEADPAALSAETFLLNDAQLVVAREYGFSNWAELKERINANSVTPAEWGRTFPEKGWVNAEAMRVVESK